MAIWFFAIKGVKYGVCGVLAGLLGDFYETLTIM
jgi:hypothetical protein